MTKLDWTTDDGDVKEDDSDAEGTTPLILASIWSDLESSFFSRVSLSSSVSSEPADLLILRGREDIMSG